MSAVDPDGISEIVALAQTSGIAGYRKPDEPSKGEAATMATPAEDAALFALIRDSGLPGYDPKRLGVSHDAPYR